MTVAICPSCEEQITLHGHVKLGQRVKCPYCGAELEVIETDPLELDWAPLEDWDEDEDEDKDNY